MNGIKKSFESILGDDFINIEIVNSKSYKDLLIDIEYQIKNQEILIDKIAIPDIWTYTEGKKLKNYLLGISIDFNFNFTIPNNLKKYHFNYNAKPIDDIKNIKNIEEGYKVMTRITFQRFADKINILFGLKKYLLEEITSRP